MSDSLTTPIVQTSTYTFRNTAELIAFQAGLLCLPHAILDAY